MVHIRQEQYPAGTVKKLQSVGPFKVFKKVRINAYILELLESFGIRKTFDIAYLLPFTGSIAIPSNFFSDLLSKITQPSPELIMPPLPHTAPHLKYHVDHMLDDKVVATRGKQCHRYHFRWMFTDEPPTSEWHSESGVNSGKPSVSEWHSGSVEISEDPSTSMTEVSFSHDFVIPEKYLSAGTNWRTLLSSVDRVSDFALPPHDDYHIRPQFRIRG